MRLVHVHCCASEYIICRSLKSSNSYFSGQRRHRGGKRHTQKQLDDEGSTSIAAFASAATAEQ